MRRGRRHELEHVAHRSTAETRFAKTKHPKIIVATSPRKLIAQAFGHETPDASP